jgi:hypothetical protein
MENAKKGVNNGVGTSSNILSHLQSNLTTIIWGVFLAIGGASFLMYFARIGFMPELGLEASIALLVAMTLNVFIYFILLCFYTTVPGVSWSIAARGTTHLKAMLDADSTKEKDGVSKWLFLLFIFPSVLYVTALDLLLWFARLGWSLFFLLPILYLATVIITRKEWTSREKMRFALYLFLSWVYFFVPFFLIYQLAKRPRFLTSGNIFVDTFSLQLLIVFTTICVLRIPKNKNLVLWHIFIGAMSLGIIIIVLGAWATIPAFVMRTFSWGNITDASIVVSHQGCSSLYNIGLEPACTNSLPCLDKDSTYRFDGIDILSRLGHFYYLRDKRGVKFSLPSSVIMAWGKPNGKIALPCPSIKP